MGRPLHDLTGQHFGRLVVESRITGTQGSSSWVCRCDCGLVKHIAASSLKAGDTKSCGCLNREVTSARNKTDKVTHGKSGTAIYVVWQSMKRRCYDPRTDSYKNYGARGISMYQKWRRSFVSFYRWAMSNGYRQGLTIERRNNDGPYSPRNCRWATPSEQSNNRRNSVRKTLDGITMTATEWARRYGLPPTRVHQRLKYGWKLRKALTAHTNGGQRL